MSDAYRRRFDLVLIVIVLIVVAAAALTLTHDTEPAFDSEPAAMEEDPHRYH